VKGIIENCVEGWHIKGLIKFIKIGYHRIFSKNTEGIYTERHDFHNYFLLTAKYIYENHSGRTKWKVLALEIFHQTGGNILVKKNGVLDNRSVRKHISNQYGVKSLYLYSILSSIKPCAGAQKSRCFGFISASLSSKNETGI
jgi:hypothetical protein